MSRRRSWLAAPLACCAGALIAGAAGCAASQPPAQAPAAPSAAPAAGAPAGSVTEAPALAPLPPPETGPEAAPEPALASAPAPTGSVEAAPAPAPASAPASAPAPAPASASAAAPRSVLLADEAPVSARAHAAVADPAHARAHEARQEHHHPHDGAHDTRRPYHPAPGIVVDVVGVDTAGGAAASAADLQRAARNAGYWPFRQCYEAGLRRDQHISGKVSLELDVSPAGSVDRSTVTGSTVHDEMVSACVAREARRLALPGGESPATAKIDVTLVTGDEPVPSGRPVPGADRIQQALRESWGGVRRCYSGALSSRPDTGGRLELHFKMHRDGEVSEVAEAGEARFQDGDVARCILGVYRNARLPPLHAARDRSFVYALELESKPGAQP